MHKVLDLRQSKAQETKKRIVFPLLTDGSNLTVVSVKVLEDTPSGKFIFLYVSEKESMTL